MTRSSVPPSRKGRPVRSSKSVAPSAKTSARPSHQAAGVPGEQQVVGLDVPMHHASAVQGVQALGDVAEQARELGLVGARPPVVPLARTTQGGLGRDLRQIERRLQC